MSESSSVQIVRSYGVGDPVEKNYGAYGWGGPFFIRAINGDRYQLAQEVWPSSHFCYASAAELRPAAFTAKLHPRMQEYRRAAIAEAEAKSNNPSS